jgi:ABC-2 type transport system permease protein
MILFIFFIAVNLGNIIVSYSTLYKSSEVAYLMTKPLPSVSLFVIKFLDNFFYSSTTLLFISFAALLGYGSCFAYPWYVSAGIMVFVLMPYMFLAACLAAVILLGIMRIAGTLGFRKIMGALCLIYFGFLVLFFSFSNPVLLIEQASRFYPNVDQYFVQMPLGAYQYLPNHWVAEFLFSVARKDYAAAFSSEAVLLAAASVFFIVMLAAAKRLYFKTWLISLQIQSGRAVKKGGGRIRLFDFRKESFLSPKVESLVKKDFFMFFREPSQWIHLLVLLTIAGTFILSLKNMNLNIRIESMQFFTYLILFAFSGFMIASLALRFMYPMCELEGKQFWSIRSAPVRLEQWFVLKFIIGFSLVLTLTEVISWAMNIPFIRYNPRGEFLNWFGIYAGFWLASAMAALNLGFGAFFAEYAEKNPIRAASSQGATLTFLSSLLYLFVFLAIVLLPLSNYFQSLFHFTKFSRESIVVPGTAAAMLSMLAGVWGWHIGLRSLKRDFLN